MGVGGAQGKQKTMKHVSSNKDALKQQQINNEYAKLLAKLMKRRTLTPANIEICRKLGFVIEIKEN